MERSEVFFTKMTFIGVDPTAGERPIVYAALDGDLNLVALGEGSLDEVLAFSAGQRQAAVAVCSPRSPNSGIMRSVEVREKLIPPPAPGRWENCRLAEYFLRQRGYQTPLTPADESDCPNWMRRGFELFRRLGSLGYKLYPQEDSERLCLEVYPHAVYSVMLETTPFPKNTLEGRLQRQLVLFIKELRIPDPMEFFEEITRHRLLRGILPVESLYRTGELDALVAAYIAWRAICQPESVTLIGDANEGQTTLPVS